MYNVTLIGIVTMSPPTHNYYILIKSFCKEKRKKEKTHHIKELVKWLKV
jgi:hypothetical protein